MQFRVKDRTAAFMPQHGAPMCITAKFQPVTSFSVFSGGFNLENVMTQKLTRWCLVTGDLVSMR